MQSNEIIFIINQQERIQLFLSGKMEDILRYDFLKAVYVKDDVCELVIYADYDSMEFVSVLNAALKQALIGECRLDESLRENLGYLWRMYLNDSLKIPIGSKRPTWIGLDYLLWQTGDVDVWLYEKEGKTFFEMTPAYKWHFKKPKSKEKERYITFQQFIENYKSCAVVGLSSKVIREWIQQTDQLLALLFFNDYKYHVYSEDGEK